MEKIRGDAETGGGVPPVRTSRAPRRLRQILEPNSLGSNQAPRATIWIHCVRGLCDLVAPAGLCVT